MWSLTPVSDNFNDRRVPHNIKARLAYKTIPAHGDSSLNPWAFFCLYFADKSKRSRRSGGIPRQQKHLTE